jgi:hypothetical protein
LLFSVKYNLIMLSQSLTTKYNNFAKDLRQTGNGVQEEGSPHVELPWYVGPHGPNDATPDHAVNLWGMSITGLRVRILTVASR